MKTLSLKEMRKLSIVFVSAICIAIAGLSVISEKQTPTQQVGAISAYASGETKGGVSSVFSYVANGCAGISGEMTVFGLSAPYGDNDKPNRLEILGYNRYYCFVK